jgi:photosystem II stability/assembly factor-like uncharacterized protein
MASRLPLVAVVIATTAIVLEAAPIWTTQTSNSTASLRGVSAVDDKIAWASGSRATVLRTIDGGETWTPIPVPGAEGLDFRDVDAVDDKTAYILSIDSGPKSRIYKTTDAGATWQLQFQNDDPKAFYDAMTFADRDFGVAVSDSVDGQFVVRMTRDGGRAWSRVPPERLPPAQPGEGYFAASGTNVALAGRTHIWLATGAAPRARVVRSTDGGATWSVSDTPLPGGPSSGIYSIAFRDRLNGIVVGGDYSKESEAIDNIAITRDGGASWTLVKRPDGTSALSGFRSVVAYVPGTKSIMAIGPSGSDISTDDGATWTAIEGPGFHTFSFAKGKPIGWGAGSRGRIAKLSRWTLTEPELNR